EESGGGQQQNGKNQAHGELRSKGRCVGYIAVAMSTPAASARRSRTPLPTLPVTQRADITRHAQSPPVPACSGTLRPCLAYLSPALAALAAGLLRRVAGTGGRRRPLAHVV